VSCLNRLEINTLSSLRLPDEIEEERAASCRPLLEYLGYGAIFIAGLLQPLWPVEVMAATRNRQHVPLLSLSIIFCQRESSFLWMVGPLGVHPARAFLIFP
jgi:hypothetical protein